MKVSRSHLNFEKTGIVVQQHAKGGVPGILDIAP
jgi:hypothetical protein